MNSLWFFDDVNLFNLLCPHKFKEYKTCHNFDAYSKNDYIYFEEDAANKIYLIERGKVKIGYYAQDGKEVIKTILSKGELFGEKAILGEVTRNEFAQSIDALTSICPIGVDTMHDLMRGDKSFSLKINKIKSVLLYHSYITKDKLRTFKASEASWMHSYSAPGRPQGLIVT